MTHPEFLPDYLLDEPEYPPVMGDCEACHGMGIAKNKGMGGKFGECLTCDGTGQVQVFE